MTPVDVALVRRKLARIVQNLDSLRAAESLTLAEYLADRFRQKGIEKLIQEVVESAVDANLHLLRDVGRAAPDYYSSFLEAGRAGIITPELGRALAPAAGLRNRLVHEYEQIDDATVLAAVATARRQFTEYVRHVETYLETR